MAQELLADIERHFRQSSDSTGLQALSAPLRRVLERVDRCAFVPAERASHAKQDSALPIGCGQTISQPFIVALMTQLLEARPCHRILDIGTGSGYQAAVLAELVACVHSLEVIPELAVSARERLAALGYQNVHVGEADGWHGLPELAPFDGILVAAVVAEPPPPLVQQLAPGGRMLVPLGEPHGRQFLTVVQREPGGGVLQRPVLPVSFVPFTRAH